MASVKWSITLLLTRIIHIVIADCHWWWCPEDPEGKVVGYGADPDMVSVSGVSAGAYMSIQMHVAYSASIMGSGNVAGGPYHCSEGSVRTALSSCMDKPEAIDVEGLINFTFDKEASDEIDPVSNLANHKTWIFSGTRDTAVDQGVSVALEDYCKYFMPRANIATDYSVAAGHAMITEHYGNKCSDQRNPYINGCDYPAAYYILDHIYGGALKMPSQWGVALSGDMLQFNQTQLIPSYRGSHSLDDIGFMYVPSGCRSTPGCKLHIVFHGCNQGRYKLGAEYAVATGYNEVGEENNIIMVYPQAVTSIGNGLGCFDWMGYTDNKYDLKEGVQMEFGKNIIDRVTSEHHACGFFRSQMKQKPCLGASAPPPTPTLQPTPVYC
ncbi:poly(3-hydroxybutyrate) depolymerase-like [Saccoglossus kowalevskii]